MKEQVLTLTIRPETDQGSTPGVRIDVVVSAEHASTVQVERFENPEPIDADGPVPVLAPDSVPGVKPKAADVREWARRHGMSVADVGRIPVEVVEQYTASLATTGFRESRRAHTAERSTDAD